MKILIAVANGLTITSSMVGMSYLYKFWWRRAGRKPLVASMIIIGATAIVTALQFVWPPLLPAMRRDLAALNAGEWWRIVTPLFVQPYGVIQCLFNGIFLLVFLPLCERLFGQGIWAIYFISGMVGQTVNYWWSPEGGGASTAAFGLMGASLVYLLRIGREIPTGYRLLPGIAFLGASTMCFIRDGHGPGLLTGALIASILNLAPNRESSSVTNHMSSTPKQSADPTSMNTDEKFRASDPLKAGPQLTREVGILFKTNFAGNRTYRDVSDPPQRSFRVAFA